MSAQASSDLYLSPDQQDLLMAALNSNPSVSQKSDVHHQRSNSQNLSYTPAMSTAPGSGNLDFSDESPYLDFDPDGEFDDSFNPDETGRMIGDLPGSDGGVDAPSGELHDKRKSIEGKEDDDEGGGKRREGEDKTAKKPGRKPLTSEPTSKRKAQNRAAQRAFRERKEKHLKDLETKVEDLEKASESANHENGLLRAQVERLQVELREYRKRLSWISSNGVGRAQAPVGATQFKNNPVSNHNDFKFEFPKFGDLPPMPTNMFNDSSAPPQKSSSSSSPGTITANRAATVPTPSSTPLGQQATRHATSGAVSQHPTPRYGSLSQSPISNTISASPQPQPKGSVDSLTGLFSPSILEASRHASFGGYFPQNTFGNATQGTRPSMDNGTATGRVPGVYSSSSMSNNSDSPGSSSESHNAVSSIGTSPEPSLNSPANKLNEYNLNTISEDNQLSTFGALSSSTPVFDANGVNWLTQQNGSNFDPILFGDYRDTQDNILSQDFGSFFNDAYPLPDLGSPLHNYNEVAPDSAPKIDLLKQVDATQDGKEEVVPDSDNKPLTCNKIWDRLQSMEKFRNGEIDIDNLCSELRAKAKCSEGGAVVEKKDVDKILGVAK